MEVHHPVRGVFAGGQNPALQSLIQFITIQHSVMLKFLEICLQIEMDIVKAAQIRSGDYFLEVLVPGTVNTIEYVTFSTTGDATPVMVWGDLTAATDTHVLVAQIL